MHQTPHAEYRRRYERNDTAAAQLAQRDVRIANGRLAVFLTGLAVAWAAYTYAAVSWWWLALPAAAFVALLVRHQHTIDAMRRARLLTAYYRRALDRLEGRWMGRGIPGGEFLTGDHPYGNDLDIVGPSSLFELLCTAHTRIGQHTLASWLLEAAEPETIRARQAAVAELRDALDLREDLALLGEEVDRHVNPHALREWASQPRRFASLRSQRVARVLAVLLVLAVASIPWLGFLPTIVVFVTGLVLLSLWRRPLEAVAQAVEEPRRELAVLAHVVARLEQETWHSPLLQSLSATFTDGGEKASHRLARLDRLVYFMELPHNQFFAPVAIASMWAVHVAHALEQWRTQSGPYVGPWLSAVGSLEALLSLAAYAYEHPDDPFPVIEGGSAKFVAYDLGHPILSDTACVRNDLSLGGTLRLLIVSGSNMSGKSTLLRMAGINAVLAQAGAPVRARELVMSPLRVGATLHVQDSIQAGASRFYAEIARLKQVSDLADEAPTLYLFDEILSGTNSHDRRIGAAAVLRVLVERGAIGMITTHDLALTRLVERVGPAADNVHFTDEWRDGRLVFPYRLLPGVVQQGNALRLMASLGLPVEPIPETPRPGT